MKTQNAGTGAGLIAAFGLENQSWEDFIMPLRLFSYDGAFYNSQVNRYRSERQEKRTVSPLYPAITVVLYFGKRHWYGPRTLRDCFRDLPEELEPFIPDYPIHIVDFIDDYIDRRHEEYKTIIADKDRALADKDRALADRDRALAESKRALADRDREIQELKSRLGIV